MPGAVQAIKSPPEILTVLKEYFTFYKYRSSKVRPLVKAPIALFSAEWLAARFDMDVLILIRHPAAFVSSLKIKNWNFPFDHFLQQPKLIRNHLAIYEEEIQEYATQKFEVINQAILLWKFFVQ